MEQHERNHGKEVRIKEERPSDVLFFSLQTALINIWSNMAIFEVFVNTRELKWTQC